MRRLEANIGKLATAGGFRWRHFEQFCSGSAVADVRELGDLDAPVARSTLAQAVVTRLAARLFARRLIATTSPTTSTTATPEIAPISNALVPPDPLAE